jgi:SAM-dependent methyltransferase
MTDSDWKNRTRRFYDAEASDYRNLYSTDQETYPANRIRLRHVLEALQECGARTVLDLGCGSGFPLAAMLDAGLDAVGVDFSENMVAEARALLSERGHDPDRARLGDAENADSVPSAKYDAVVALGVFPHVIDEPAVVGNMARALRPGGRFIAEFRNAVFSAFTLNEYSLPFYMEAFVDSVGALGDDTPLRSATEAFYGNAFNIPDQPAPFDLSSDTGELTYQQLLAKFHNPLAISELLGPAGLRLEHNIYYHFHVAPPSLEGQDPSAYREKSLHMEQRLARDWRGAFMASAFVSVAVKD